MKIFYKTITNAAEVIEKNQFSHEQLIFPSNLFQDLKDNLVESGELLPESARKFQEWNIGLLKRFDGRDFAGGGEDVSVAPTPEADVPENMEGKEKVSVEEALRKIPGGESLLE